MSNEKVVIYINCVLIAKRMLKQGLIDQDDFNKMEEAVATNYGIKNNSIYRTIDLIYSYFRGNM